jgi:hypothetical protein
MHATQAPSAPAALEPVAAPPPAPQPAAPAASAESKSVPFRRLIVFDSLADAVGCGGAA